MWTVETATPGRQLVCALNPKPQSHRLPGAGLGGRRRRVVIGVVKPWRVGASLGRRLHVRRRVSLQRSGEYSQYYSQGWMVCVYCA